MLMTQFKNKNEFFTSCKKTEISMGFKYLNIFLHFRLLETLSKVVRIGFIGR